MQGFRDFVNQMGDWATSLWQWLTGWFQRAKSTVLASMRVTSTKDGISFSFPKQPIVAEAYRFDKGLRIAGHIDQDQQWSAKDTAAFGKNMNANLRHIAGHLGFVFEMEVVVHLVNQGLSLEGIEMNEFMDRHEEYLGRVKQHLNKFTYEQFIGYVRRHAAELGNAMIQRTQGSLKCSPKSVYYDPHVQGDEDLVLSCRKGRAGWSLKYASEPLINIRTLSIENALTVLGASHIYPDLKQKIEADPESEWGLTLDTVWKFLGENRWTDDPNNFTKLLTFLLRGNDRTFVAAKNYTMDKATVGTASEAMLRDFNVRRTSNGVLFSPKPGAVVQAIKTSDYIKFQYKLVGGANTYIMFRMRTEGRTGSTRVMFYMNNLTS